MPLSLQPLWAWPLWAPLGRCGLDPCEPSWALVGKALWPPLGPFGPCPSGAPLAFVGQSLVGPSGRLWAGALWAALGTWWAEPSWSSLGPCGSGFCGLGPCGALWALVGWALVGPCRPGPCGPPRALVGPGCALAQWIGPGGRYDRTVHGTTDNAIVIGSGSGSTSCTMTPNL